MILNNINISKQSITACIVLLSALSTLSQSVLADGTIVNGRTVSGVVNSSSANSCYTPAFFEQYMPQNAMEMIERLPGFSFDQGSNARGFGGNAGNVLIDGARPTSKSGGLRSVLSRIPAEQVARIEVFRGGVSAGEASGQSIVANVIRNRNGTSATWTAKAYRSPDGSIKPSMESGISTELGGWDTHFELKKGGRTDYRSAVNENLDANGQLTSIAKEDRPIEFNWTVFSGEGSRDIADGKLAVNSQIARYKGEFDTIRDIYNELEDVNPSVDEHWSLDENSSKEIFELGADWTKTYDNWKWRLIGLGQIEDHNYRSETISDKIESADDDSDSLYSQDRLKSEYIARTTFSKISSSSFKPEFGLEIARNKLEAELEYFTNGEEVGLDNADVTVEELRAEIFATFIVEATDDVTIEGGLTAELSEIKVSGDTNQKQSFQFLKPRLSTTYKVDDDTSVIFEAEHRIGQLNFNDFASSSQASDDRTVSGNPDMVPDQSTAVTATYDWSFSGLGNLKVVAFHEWRSDILENIVLPSGGHGLGNAGDARYWGVVTDLNLPLDLILSNSLLEISYKYRRSSFDDPIINGNRTIASYAPDWLHFKFRQDLVGKKFAWGGEYHGSFTETGYLVDEIQTMQGNKRIRLYIESTRFFGVKTQLEVSQVNTGRYKRTRSFFDDDRSGEFTGSEVSKREQGPEVRLSFKGKF